MPVLPVHAVIGSYRIEKLIGSGGMGEVYRATNLQTRTPVAVKALTLTGGASTALARFRNEAVIQYNLRHRNVVELYEYFEYQGVPCLAMEFVDGRTLTEWIREAGPLDLPRALEIMADICDAVSYMHSRGTIHRDIKSENVRIGADGKAKLLDFGISISRDTPTLTRTGYSIGTPEKMAPEQHLGLRGDARSDVWALGVLFYEIVTGALPFTGSNEAGLKEDILATRYISATRRRPALPRNVSRTITSCLRPKPEERYASGGVLLREIQQLRRGFASREGRNWLRQPAAIAGALGVLAIGLLAVLFRPDPEPALQPVSGQGATVVSKDPRSNRRAGSFEANSPAPSEKPTAVPGLAVRSAAGDAGQPAARAADLQQAAEPGAERKTLLVSTYDGPAEVLNDDGKVLGTTPYQLTGPRGASYELWLSRPGFQPRKIDVEINNKNEYLFGLEKKE